MLLLTALWKLMHEYYNLKHSLLHNSNKPLWPCLSFKSQKACTIYMALYILIDFQRDGGRWERAGSGWVGVLCNWQWTAFINMENVEIHSKCIPTVYLENIVLSLNIFSKQNNKKTGECFRKKLKSIFHLTLFPVVSPLYCEIRDVVHHPFLQGLCP